MADRLFFKDLPCLLLLAQESKVPSLVLTALLHNPAPLLSDISAGCAVLVIVQEPKSIPARGLSLMFSHSLNSQPNSENPYFTQTMMKHGLREAGIPPAILRDGNASQVGRTGRHKPEPQSQTRLLAASHGVST